MIPEYLQIRICHVLANKLFDQLLLACQPRVKKREEKTLLFSKGFIQHFDLPFISNIFGFIQSELSEMIEEEMFKIIKLEQKMVKMFSFLWLESEISFGELFSQI